MSAARSSRRSMIRGVAVLAVLATIAACGADAAHAPSTSPTAVADAPDPMADVSAYKGWNTRTNVMPGPGPASEPAVLWEVRLDAVIESQPLLVDGTVIVATTGGELVGIVADTGGPAWGPVDLPAGVRSQPAVDAGTLYLVTDDGMLRAMSLADRTERWPAVPGFEPEATIAVADGLVIAGGPDALVAVRAADGTEAWRVGAERSTRLAVDNGFAYASANDSGTMTKVDLASREASVLDVGGADVLTAGLDRGGVVVGYRDEAGGENGAVAFGQDGTELWREPSIDHARVDVVTLTDDLVLVATEVPARIEARNRSNGHLVWPSEYDGSLVGGPVVAGNVMYLVAGLDGVIAVDLASHKQQWSVPLEVSQKPVRFVVTGGLIVASVPSFDGAGRVVAFADPADPRSLALRSPSAATPTADPAPAATPTPGFEVLEVGDTIEDLGFAAGPTLGPDGTLYIADPTTSRVLVRAPDGTESWWGTPGSGVGEFNFTGGGNVAVSPDGALIAVAETGNHRVQLFDAQRHHITMFGRLGDGPKQFDRPGVTIDSQHRIWVVDARRMDIQLFTGDGTYVTKFASEGRGDGQLDEPGGTDFREDTGELYVADFANHRISVFNENGWVRNYESRRDEGLVLNEVNDVEVDGAGRMFVVDTSNRIFVLDRDGKRLETIPARLPEGVGPVDVPGFALDGKGRLYLSDVLQTRIIVLQLLPPLWPPPG